MDQLRRELQAARDELSRVARGLLRLHRAIDQVSTLRDLDADVEARIASLERMLDFERAALHVRSAVMQTEVIETPVPHLLVSGLFPPDVYQALLDAIPPRVFFDRTDEGGEALRMPPRLAPTPSILTWMFLTDVVIRTLSPSLIARFREPLDAFISTRFPALPPRSEWDVALTLSEGRLVRTGPGAAGTAAPDRRWDFLTTVVWLDRPNDDDPLAANRALTFLGSVQGRQFAPMSRRVPAETDRYTYEFGIGPDRQTRRRLEGMLSAVGQSAGP